MSYLEEELKRALQREEPPADFADGVLARVSQPPQPSWRERWSSLMRPPRVQWVAVSVMVSVLLPSAGFLYRREMDQRAEGERAKQQLLLAVHIAGRRLHQTQKKVLESGRLDSRI